MEQARDHEVWSRSSRAGLSRYGWYDEGGGCVLRSLLHDNDKDSFASAMDIPPRGRVRHGKRCWTLGCRNTGKVALSDPRQSPVKTVTVSTAGDMVMIACRWREPRYDGPGLTCL